MSRAQSNDPRIEGTPDFGIMPTLETHEVTGYWRQDKDGKALVAPKHADLNMVAALSASDRACDKCGSRTGYVHLMECPACKRKRLAAEIEAAPFGDDLGGPIYSWYLDEYFSDFDEIQERLDQINEDECSIIAIDDLLLCTTHPEPPPTYDAWDEPLHDDDDGDWWDGECQAALDALNIAMAAAAPRTWRPTKLRHPMA